MVGEEGVVRTEERDDGDEKEEEEDGRGRERCGERRGREDGEGVGVSEVVKEGVGE